MTPGTKKWIGGFALAALLLVVAIITVNGEGFSRNAVQRNQERKAMAGELKDLPQNEAEWKEILTPEQYEILRRQGTERAFSGAYWDTKTKGVYRCAGCGQPLFSSETKYDSGTGWPSFWQPIEQESVDTRPDKGLFTTRTEVICSRCDGHLGHVFNDGPRPTGLRYCLNSAAIQLEADDSNKSADDDSAGDGADEPPDQSANP